MKMKNRMREVRIQRIHNRREEKKQKKWVNKLRIEEEETISRLKKCSAIDQTHVCMCGSGHLLLSVLH